jgi:hypothetical protein
LSDLHIRILRLMAHRAAGELHAHDALESRPDAASSDRRRHLARA